MKISELISKLESIKAEHGDLPVMTPGFDESGRDDIGDISIEQVYQDNAGGFHCGKYDVVSEYREPKGTPFTVVTLNF